MKDKIKTYQVLEINQEEIQQANEQYHFQKDLTKRLDQITGDFDQENINEIILWKVNRYASISIEALKLLNAIEKETLKLDFVLTRAILCLLLNSPGIRLPIASTILRFKNPQIYQIIDQRVFRFLYGYTLKEGLKKEKDQIKLYLDYLIKLREVCETLDIPFDKSDRILYELDKKHNKNIKVSY
jgi:thermostable 8-oxoguanine DNA glycosylase